MKLVKGIFFFSASMILCLGCSTGTGGGSGANDSDATLIASYGVKTDLGAPTDANGKDLPSTYNPLGNKTSSVMARKELFISGIEWKESGGNPRAFVLDESSTNSFASIKAQDSDYTWAKYPHATASGDIDGNGVEEAVSVVFSTAIGDLNTKADNKGTAKLEIVTLSGSTYNREEVPLSGDFHIVLDDESSVKYYQMSIALGDIDGDGRDEIGLCVGNTFVVLDDGKASYSALQTVDYRGGAYTDHSHFRITAVTSGDINDDGMDEFIVTDGVDASTDAAYYIYGGSSGAEICDNTISGDDKTFQTCVATIGDIDGDYAKEVVFAGEAADKNEKYYVLVGKWDAASSKLKFMPCSYSDSFDWSNHARLPLVCFNPTGKTTKVADSIYVEQHVLTYGTSTGSAAFSADSVFESLSDDHREAFKDCVAAGDFNEDGKDELAIIDYNDRNLHIIGYGSGSSLKQLNGTIDCGEDSAYSPTICAADLVGDSTVVQYVGRELRFTDPKIVAVLASPPYYSQYVDSGSLSNYSTTFGTSSASGTSNSNTFSVNASFTIGTSVEAPLWGSALSVEETATFGTSFSYTASKSMETETTQSYSTIGGEDLVIISCIPMDVYSYKVLAAGNADTVGSTVTVDIPRTPQMIPLEKGRYNALSGVPVSVDSSILAHTVGSPSSYPSYSAIKSLEDDSDTEGLWDPNGMSIGISGGYVTDEVEQNKTTEKTYGAGFSYQASVTVVASGVLFGASYGFEDDYSYTVTTSEGTIIEGVVPNLPTTGSDSTDIFKFGIASYKSSVKNQSQKFIVVTYWVTE